MVSHGVQLVQQHDVTAVYLAQHKEWVGLPMTKGGHVPWQLVQASPAAWQHRHCACQHSGGNKEMQALMQLPDN
jgi:hypothetical protein